MQIPPQLVLRLIGIACAAEADPPLHAAVKVGEGGTGFRLRRTDEPEHVRREVRDYAAPPAQCVGTMASFSAAKSG